MGRRREQYKRKINVVVNGNTVSVILHPPTQRRKSWFAYWPGLTYSRSTGQRDFDQAVISAEAMIRNGGKPIRLADTMLTDEEFKAVQKDHYKKRPDRKRAEKSLANCLEAIDAFIEISGISPMVSATPDDCASFQRNALKLPKSHRLKYPKKRTEGVACYSEHTVLKWSRALQAAFERVNVNAGKKCIRGVVDESKLLTSNPWHAFTWIGAEDKKKRQFTRAELCSILDYFHERWTGITVATAAAKFCLWSGARLSEFAGLNWDELREVGGGYHFDLDCKMGLKRWVRIPRGLFLELQQLRRTGSQYVFAAYNDQLRGFYEAAGQAKFARKVGHQFVPRAFADWFQERIPDWAEATQSPHATPHVFRKTSQQCARSGEDEEDINKRVAEDLKVTPQVMLRHYVDERDLELWAASNRNYRRILASLPIDVAQRYGYTPENGAEKLEAEAKAAMAAQDWKLLATLAQELADQGA